ncbi:30S ribosomal protein S5 [candidate division SR1 bacterium Aalborg_AAW-1]|nr:30S ribosomal protein S5 [candidate division SR1 bacterium Aalborg_AAW-1]
MKEKLQGFEEALLEVRKVTKVTTGGRRMRFRAIVLVGDRAGHIGLGVGKGNDVSIAVTKATHDAYKNVRDVSITKTGSVPYMVTNKYKACYVTLRPAGAGTGLKAGSSVRTVLELSGYSNILSKIIGSNNPLNNAIATITALTTFKVNVDNIQEVKAVVKEKIEDKKDDRKGKFSKKSDTAKKPTRSTSKKTEQSDTSSESAE